jgi:hypothetical protein
MSKFPILIIKDASLVHRVLTALYEVQVHSTYLEIPMVVLHLISTKHNQTVISIMDYSIMECDITLFLISSE